MTDIFQRGDGGADTDDEEETFHNNPAEEFCDIIKHSQASKNHVESDEIVRVILNDLISEIVEKNSLAIRTSEEEIAQSSVKKRKRLSAISGDDTKVMTALVSHLQKGFGTC